MNNPYKSSLKIKDVIFCRKKTKGVMLVGHPRFGSGYITNVIRASGFDVGHEFVKEDGVVSWMYAVQDWCYPYGDFFGAQQYSFSKTYAFIRNPVKALPSCMVENRSKRSFEFRRAHIYDTFGVDISSFQGEANRAAVSIIYWYKICELLEPDGIVKVDDRESVKAFLRKLGVNDNHVIDKALCLPPKNTSEVKWKDKPGKKKPILDKFLIDQLDSDVKEKLYQLGDAYGYDFHALGFEAISDF